MKLKPICLKSKFPTFLFAIGNIHYSTKLFYLQGRNNNDSL
jgi:hypothetical protein